MWKYLKEKFSKDDYFKNFRFIAINTFYKARWKKCHSILYRPKNPMGRIEVFKAYNKLHLWSTVQVYSFKNLSTTQKIKVCDMFFKGCYWVLHHNKNSDSHDGTFPNINKVFSLVIQQERQLTYTNIPTKN